MRKAGAHYHNDAYRLRHLLLHFKSMFITLNDVPAIRINRSKMKYRRKEMIFSAQSRQIDRFLDRLAYIRLVRDFRKEKFL